VSTLRRFIAGAVCPQCHEIDKLFVREEAAQRVCECVRCGHRMVLDRDGAGSETGAADTVRVIDRAPD
jgi:uncharacterized metal-binding protein (TIGR02443 family)